MIYGNYSLQRDDNDGNPSASQSPTWGGAVATPVPLAAQTPQNQGGATLAIPQHVRQLQEDLRELGFFMIQVVDGDFGRYTEWAVREFQIYAGMSHVAGLNRNELTTLTNDPNAGETAPEVTARGQVPNQSPAVSFYVATLEQRANTARYTGPISGVVNQQTREAIEHWLANNYRCPVVIEAWNISGNNRSTLFQNGSNIWRVDQVPTTAPRFFYRDFSSYYAYPTTRSQDDYHVLGSYMTLASTSTSGQLSKVPAHTWRESEILPENLIGSTYSINSLASNMSSPETSTYKIVRAVSEMECMGAFDSVNTYDNALVSLGPCHWTMGVQPIHSPDYINGELPAFLAYFLYRSEPNYKRLFGRFGLYPYARWAGPNAAPFWDSTGLKYTGWVKLHSESTNPNAMPADVSQMTHMDKKGAEADYLKTWHWFFRFVLAGRTNPEFQRSMWDMTRMRIKDVLNKSLNFSVGPSSIHAKISEIFTSEKSISIILRWHIFRPSHIALASGNNNILVQVIQSAIASNNSIAWSLPLAQWGNQHETALIQKLLPAAAQVNHTQLLLANWPNYGNRTNYGFALNNQLGILRSERNSFLFNGSGI